MTDLHQTSVMEVEQPVVERDFDGELAGLDALDQQLLDQLIGQAKDRGVKLAGEGGLLQALNKRLLESALDGEITDYLGYVKLDAAGDGSRPASASSSPVPSIEA